jgi:hypothetical protein
MKTIDEVKSEREAAGAAYQAAVESFFEAWTELHALDLVMTNAVYGDPSAHVKRFTEEPLALPQHGDFPAALWSPSFGRRAWARHEDILREMEAR